MNEKIDALIEILAAGEHKQWSTWALEILNNEPGLSAKRRKRWMNLIATPYKDLPEDLKNIDRKEVCLWSCLAIEIIKYQYNIIDKTANNFLKLEPGIKWEGGIDEAMAALVEEVKRLRETIAKLEGNRGGINNDRTY